MMATEALSAADHRSLGIAAALAAVLIGAGWHIATRLGVTTTLHPVDLALLRYGAPAVAMSPVLLRTGLLPAGVPRGWLALVVVGAGLPFGLLAMAGSRFAPVAHMGVIIPGGMAIGVAALAWLISGERFAPRRLMGFGLLTIAILLIGSGAFVSVTSRTLLGDAMFLVGAILWAGYTVAFRRCGLTPVQGIALISGWSLLLVVPLWLMTPDARLLQAPLADVGIQILWQSVLAGLVGVWTYGFAVRSIGPANTAAIGALLPVASSVGGLLVLGEAVSVRTALAIGLAVVGVLLSIRYPTRPPEGRG
jgi:drug/metabolite transporter (DMT)-like permease